MTPDRKLQQLYGAVGGALSWARDPEAKRRDSLKGAETGAARHYGGSMRAWSAMMHARKRKRKLEIEQAADVGPRPVSHQEAGPDGLSV